MASTMPLLEAPIPRPLLWIGTPIAGFVLVLLFVFLGFPYEMLAGNLSARLSEATGSQVEIRDLEPRITIAGPGMSLRDVSVTPPAQSPLAFDHIAVRPAWSSSWLSLEPAVYIDLGSEYGSAAGTLILSATPRFDGAFNQIDLARIPVALPGGIRWAGFMEADTDITQSADGPVGEITVQARQGTVVHPNLPMPLEFDVLTANVELGRRHFVDINQLDLEGPVLAARVSGHIERGRGPANQPVDMAVDVQIKTPPLQAMLRNFGVALDGEGRAKFKLGGTLSSPRLR